MAAPAINTPATIPLIVEPTTIVKSCDLTSGVNQEVSPSKMPKIPPKINPYATLFIASSPVALLLSLFY